jgi:hypothetical protein
VTRFPASRTALWNPEPQGLPVHLSHASCVPSLLLPLGVSETLRDFLRDVGPGGADPMELLGREAAVDHLLRYPRSTTRSTVQLVMEHVRRAPRFGADPDAPAAAQAPGAAVPLCISYRPETAAAAARAARPPDAAARAAAVQRVLLRLQGPPGPASAGAFVAARLEAERLRGEAALLSAELTLPCESFLLSPLKLLKVRAPLAERSDAL